MEDKKHIAEKHRDLYKIGKISKEEASKFIKPYIDELNKKSIQIAEKYNQKPKKVSVAKYLSHPTYY
jgi:polyhydroxyalkanoate synthesis regulator phasin